MITSHMMYGYIVIRIDVATEDLKKKFKNNTKLSSWVMKE